MKKIIFFDVDTQYDFINPKGKLYVKGAEKIIKNLRFLTGFAEKNNIPIISSVDAHSTDDPEFRRFPAHCICGTAGQKKIRETRLKGAVYIPAGKGSSGTGRYSEKKLSGLLTRAGQIVFEKKTIDAFSNPDLKKVLSGVKTAYVYGVATEYCVKAAVSGLRKNRIETYVIRDAIRAAGRKDGMRALSQMKKKGAKFIKVAEIPKLLGGKQDGKG